jgi:single-stranded-DNA-specific exonuclease
MAASSTVRRRRQNSAYRPALLVCPPPPSPGEGACRRDADRRSPVATKGREHRWKLAEPVDAAASAKLSREINVPDPIARILIDRGIDSYESAKVYFRPSLDSLHDPFLLSDMSTAVDRLIRALQEHEPILVFGDYDVDGTNAAAMLYLFFRELGGEVAYYIPDRIREGYGISREAIERAHQTGVRLFLSVDCGIGAVEEAALAKSLGLDVIICDHHEPGPVLPDAVAVLDPIKPGDPYPFKALCGCGVGFKLIQAVAKTLGREQDVHAYLDFVAMASAADIVPLTGENRILTRLGLEILNERARPGMKALIAGAGLRSQQISTGQIIFVLGPRINAAGRLGDATRAVRLLTSTDPDEAFELAAELEEENKNRRKIDEDTFASAQRLAESLFDTDNDAAIVLHDESWHPGVVGIVASRMVEKYYKPSIMMATVDGVARGSARSINGFDIYEALRRSADTVIQFGGHRYAAGVTVDLQRIEEFRTTFVKNVQEMMTEELMMPELRIDTELSLSDITPRFMRILKELAPFGPGNPVPVFLCRDLEVVGSPRIVGKNHLRFRVRQQSTVIDAIAFGLSAYLDRVPSGRADLECVCAVEENTWVSPSGARAGNGLPQLRIKDLR